MNILIIANALHTNTLSGGDTIFVECAKRWILSGHIVCIITTQSGYRYCTAKGIPETNIRVWKMAEVDVFGFSIAIFCKSIISLWYALFSPLPPSDIIFSSSFFGPDIIPGLVSKLKHPASRLVTSFYLFSRKPLGQDYSGGRLKGFLFFLNEMLSLWIIKKFGSNILVASVFDIQEFARLKWYPTAQVTAVGGGVDTSLYYPDSTRPMLYDAVFIGRFVPQKCIDELLRVWSIVVASNNSARLAVIGGGPLESFLKILANELDISSHVDFLGIVDGEKKAAIITSSRIFISASRFDTGNIALDEALACGVPGIVYDIPSLSFTRGVVRVLLGDRVQFAAAIERVLSDTTLRKRLSGEAVAYAKSIDWTIQAAKLLDTLTT